MSEQFDSPCWFVLRDLKRFNAKAPAYKALPELGFQTFTPMHWVLTDSSTRGRQRLYVPFIPNLLFVKSLRADLDPVIAKTETLQYRYIRGAQATPMTVPTDEMERFIAAVTSAPDTCHYYTPDEITDQMLGKKVRIIGGALDGTVGHLLTRRGAKTKRLILQLQDMLIASVTIDSGYIQFI